MRSTYAIGLLAGAVLSGCVAGSGYYPGGYQSYSPPYYREYEAPYYGTYGGGGGYWESGPSRQEMRDVAREQADEQRRLNRSQQERREQLRDKQAERRDQLQADGEWRKRNANWQRQRREQQKENFQRERKDLKKQQDRQWDNVTN